jgi:hypothetical protein
MANFNEDLELIEFTFRRDEFKRGEKVFSKDHELYGEIIDRHPFVPDSWMASIMQKNGKRSTTTIHRDKIIKCPQS